jgi:hypothetical protein
VDRQREDSGASDLLDIEGTESVDGEWEADINPQNIPALASALWSTLHAPVGVWVMLHLLTVYLFFPSLKRRVE